MSFYNDASLVFLPSGGAGKDTKAYSIKPTDGNGDFTFSRGSNLTATRVDSNGLIEKGRENLLLQSNQFDTTWALSDTSVTSGQSGYDGSNDAWLLNSTTTGSPRIQQIVSSSGVSTYSVYAKAATDSFIQLRTFMTPSGDASIWVNLSNGTIVNSSGTANVTSSVESIGNGWYRCSLIINGSLSYLRMYPASAFGVYSTSGNGVYIQDAQLEQGLVATEPIESGATTSLAGILEDSPRFDYSGEASCPSLLLEPSRSSLFKYSEYFNEGTYNLVNGFTIATNSINSPEGVQNASLFTSANSTNEQYLNVNALTVANGSSYTLSVFAKKKDFDFIQLKFTGAGGRFSAAGVWFNVSTGAVGTESSGVSGSIEDYGNGWYRCSATATATGDGGGITRVQLASADNTDSVAGDGAKGTYFYGGQFEEGSYPTSYIPNHSGGSVTREFDNLSDLDVSSMLTSSSFTWFLDLNDYIGSDINQEFIFLESSTNIKIQLRVRPDGYRFYYNNIAGGSTYPIAGSTTANKFCVSYDGNDYRIYVDGALQATTASVGDSGWDFIKNVTGASLPLKQMLLFPSKLSNAECITLTS